MASKHWGEGEAGEGPEASLAHGTARPGDDPGLSAIEVASFACAIGVLFWLLPELDIRMGTGLFPRTQPGRALFASLAVTLATYFVLLSMVNLPRSSRLAGSMLATVVSVALLYLLLIVKQGLAVCAVVLTLAPGAALCSRCGLSREQGYPIALATAIGTCVAHPIIRSLMP